MRIPLVFCVAAIFVTSQGNGNYTTQNSTQDVKANYTRSLRTQISISISSDEGDDYKHRRRTQPSLIKRRVIHRSRIKANSKSRNSTSGYKQSERQERAGPTDKIDNRYDGVDLFWNHPMGGMDDTRIDIAEFGDYYPFHKALESLLARLIKALEESSEDHSDIPSSLNDNATSFDDEDLCQRWLDNREKIESSFPGSVANLPACPCLYPNAIFYDNQIWDKKQQRKFRWRDVSHEKDRLAIYKPGALYCVQTLPSQENESAVVQHCCYDADRKLLTRGSGAGTPYIVSPDISPLLHDKIDLLPWRLCKGDFTRYNKVRMPNNDNNCEVNPDDEEYQHQVENAKDY